jgi:RNA polymerase sigma factor (sigma-70 family)
VQADRRAIARQADISLDALSAPRASQLAPPAAPVGRSPGRSRARSETPVETPEEESLSAGPPEQAEASWIAWRVHRALEELTPNERSVIELAYWSGLSQSEVSEYLGIPLGTVKTRTRAALARLAGVLEEELG